MEKPHDAVLHARALAKAGQPGAGAAFLKRHRTSWPNLPPNYDLALGTLLLRSGDAASAIAYLLVARAGFAGEPPATLRHALGSAYLALDLVEAAGREFSLIEGEPESRLERPERLAIGAYQHRSRDEADSGRATPYAVLLRAERLASEDRKLEAARLLSRHRKDWAEVPSEYDILLRRLRQETVDRQADVERLTARRMAAGGQGGAAPDQELGTVLFELGRVHEAGAMLHAASQQGANIARLDLLIALDRHRSRSGLLPVDTSFARNTTIIDKQRRLAYVAVPKNASSLLKSIIVMNSASRSEFSANAASVHDFLDILSNRAPANDEVAAGDYFRFTVLRNPARRLLSGYLDIIVRGHGTHPPPLRAKQVAAAIAGAQALAGLPFDAERSITFEEFVHHVAREDDAALNMHWMPQWRTVGRDLSVYHHVGLVERLQNTLDLLTERFGYDQTVDLSKTITNADAHIAKHREDGALHEPYRVLPAELAPHAAHLPPAAAFFTDELFALINDRYATDVVLHSTALAMAEDSYPVGPQP